jgi:hypothetical protein
MASMTDTPTPETDPRAAAATALEEIRVRRAVWPTKAEIQRAITRGRQAGLTIEQISRLTGIARSQLYRDYQLDPPNPKE